MVHQSESRLYDESTRCSNINISLEFSRNLQNNKKWKNSGDRFKCDQCDKDFSTKRYLGTHIKVHKALPQKCNQCGKTYKTIANLKKHISRMHSEKEIECDECEKTFSTTSSLNFHKKTVHVLKSFKCGQCKYRSKTNSDLKKHINNVHNLCRVLYKCELCGYQAKTGSDLKIHNEAVHDKKKNWFCKACPYSTYHKQDFIKHMWAAAL